MDDVARTAGVARSTVSMVFSKDRRITAATRERVLSAARRVGYQPNPLVSVLMSARRRQISSDRHTVLAYVTAFPNGEPWRQYASFAAMYEGAERRAAELGFRLAEFSLATEGMTSRRFESMLHARGIHGLLIAPLPGGRRSIDLSLEGFAVVGLGPSVVEPTIERVSNDHFQSMLLAFEQCRIRGYRRIGFVVSRETSERLGERWHAAFVFAQQALPARDRVEPLLAPTESRIEEVLPRWCVRARPDVVIFGNYEVSRPYALPRGVRLVGLDVPDRKGPLTGIFQDDRRIGAVAVEHLVARLQRTEFGPEAVRSLNLVEGVWVSGNTA